MGFQEPLALTGRSEEVRLEWGNFSWMETVREGASKSFLEVAITEAEAGAWECGQEAQQEARGSSLRREERKSPGHGRCWPLVCCVGVLLGPRTPRPQAGTYSSNCHLPCRLGLVLNNLVPTLCLLDGALPLP